MRACTSNHPSHLIRKFHWIEKELRQVWKEATQALYLDTLLMVSLICFDIWQTLANLLVWIFVTWMTRCCKACGCILWALLHLSPKDLCPFQVPFPEILSLYFGWMSPHLGIRRVTATLIALRSPQDSCPTQLRQMTIKRSVTLEAGDSLAFVCLFSDDASSCFLENFPWPRALHSHTSRCDNSSCIRNPTPAAICLLVSVTMHRQFVLVPITHIQS